jgi:hypothetical protein
MSVGYQTMRLNLAFQPTLLRIDRDRADFMRRNQRKYYLDLCVRRS